MRRESGACAGRIRLNGISLIEQSLVVKLLEQPPKGLDIFVVVCDVGVVKVNEIAHFLGELSPLGSEFHHVLPAFSVIVLYGDIFF